MSIKQKDFLLYFLAIVCAIYTAQSIFEIGKTEGINDYPFVASKTGKLCYSVELKKELKNPVYFENIQECIDFINKQ